MHTTRLLTAIFTPSHYDMTLAIDRVGRTFEGSVKLRGTAVTSGDIILHAKDLTIHNVRVNDAPATYSAGENDELHIAAGTTEGREYALDISYSGTITDQMHGMYPCYFDHDGTAKELIATQFESHHAREVVPCIDEPDAKATFDVTLETEQNVTVLGNMPIATQEMKADRMVTTFDTTPRMSSYLLAWVIGDLHKKTATSKSGVEVNIWATPAQPTESLDFALDIATRTIDFFDAYFGVPYPLPKADHVALPDFSSGAMENWGLITYREVALLAQPGAVSVSSKHRIAAVIAHELSHQWFGNLVTMKWWNNLWLNESFANFMEYVAIDALEPSWNVWQDFAGYETVASLRRDATDGVQAVQTDVTHPDEISTLFDPAIVYAKGSRLLHMLERHIGTDPFREGLRAYFKAFAYGNTTESDLWNELSRSSGLDIAALMNPWISQPGYPVVKLDDTGLSQRQFFIGEHSDAQRLWPIPLGASDENMPKLFEGATLEYAVAPGTRLNVHDSSHFITQYSDTLLASHLESVRNGDESPISRLQLLHEQTLLARGRITTSASLVDVLDAYRNESIESVWDIMALTVGELKKFVEADESSERALKSLALELARAQYDRLGLHPIGDESASDTKLRATVLGMMIYGEDAEVLSAAKQLADGPIEAIDPELRALILGAAVRHSESQAVFDRLLEQHRTTSSAELRQDISSALTSTKNAADIEHLLKLIKDPTFVRSQDVARWFVYLIRNRHARTRAWQWVRDEWAWIEKTFAGDKSYDDYPKYASGGLVTRQQLKEYETFFTPLRSQVALRRVIDMGISELRAKVELIESDAADVRAALLKR